MKTTTPSRNHYAQTSKGAKNKGKFSKPWMKKAGHETRTPDIDISRKITILKAFLELGELRFNEWANYKERRYFKYVRLSLNAADFHSEIHREIERLNEVLINTYIPKKKGVIPVAQAAGGEGYLDRSLYRAQIR